MRQVRYSVAMSLDGYIAGPDGEFDWIPMDPDIDFGAMFARFDTLLLGRKTYETVRQQGGGPAAPGTRSYVFSTTLRQEDCKDATVSSRPEEIVPSLKQQPGKDIWLFGGGSLFNSLLGLGLVDVVEVAIVPILLGGGLRMLPEPAKQAKLRLTNHKLYEKTGIVLLEYDVV